MSSGRRQESSRGSAASRWQVETVLARGYGLATMYYGDIEPDVDGAMKLGVRGTYLKPRPGGAGRRRVGRHRGVGVGPEPGGGLPGDGQGRGRRAALALVGHSRLGKTALWAGAMDTRFGIVISNDSGEGGAAISRRRFGETVADLNSRFPHWFCGNYTQYSGREDEMPFDSHMLLALIAPRPLYVASARGGSVGGPEGRVPRRGGGRARCTDCSARRASGRATMPPVNQPVGDAVRYHVRTGKHDITAYDWQQYLDFAERQFRPKHRVRLPGGRQHNEARSTEGAR